MTKEEAVLNHRKLWNWIAIQSEKQQRFVEKEEYFYANSLPNVSYNCYCCEYAVQINRNWCKCDSCPIAWKNVRCYDDESEFERLQMAYITNNLPAYIRLARIIANLPIK